MSEGGRAGVRVWKGGAVAIEAEGRCGVLHVHINRKHKSKCKSTTRQDTVSLNVNSMSFVFSDTSVSRQYDSMLLQ